MNKQYYTFEIKKSDYNTTQIYTVDLSKRFPDLINKSGVVSINHGYLVRTATTPQPIFLRSNLLNTNSLTSSSASSNILIPFYNTVYQELSYTFNTNIPQELHFFFTNDIEGQTKIPTNQQGDFIFSFNIVLD